MSEPDVDFALCGAGPVGAACALFLVEAGIAPSRIALIDARTRAAAAADDRMIAVSHGSATLLARLDAWRDAQGSHTPPATPIETIHISQRGRFGRTVIDRDDYGVPALGYVIRHGELTGALEDTLDRRGIAVRRPQRVAAIDVEHDALRITTVGADGANVTTTARHVVHAEGGLYDGQQRRAVHRDYEQTAVTAFVEPVDAPGDALARTAFERFTDEGPLALLPAFEVSADGRRRVGYSLVWCGRPDAAARRIALPDDDFVAALHAAFGDRLGRFGYASPRRSFPLGLNAVAATARARSPTSAEFAIGNAAQTLHPVAGQGLNLGLRDAHDLAALLARRDDSATTLVATYAAMRRADRAATVNLTDLMPRVFASPLWPVVAGRGAALALLDVSRPLRGLFARQMMYGRR